MRPKAPGLALHLALLWRLRLTLALNARRGRWWGALGFAFSSLPAVPLFLGAGGIMLLPEVAGSHLWSRLYFDLVAFVTACVWVIWPLLSARVDDHSELRRYQAFPISSQRLLLSATLAGLLDPLALVLLAPLAGVVAATLLVTPALPLWPTLAVVGLFVLTTQVWSKAALHLVLGVMRHRRGAQAIGGGFLLFVLASLFIPPVDTSWLTQAASAGGVDGLDLDFALQAALGMSRVPTGLPGEALRMLRAGRPGAAALEVAMLAFFFLHGLWFAHRALVSAHRRGGGARHGEAAQPAAARRAPFVWARDTRVALLLRELLDLWHNPRARLLVFAPFVLTVALRVFSAPALIGWWLPHTAELWMVGGLCLYAVVVFATTFSQNLFGYDGRAMAAFLAAPLPLAQVVQAKARAHALAAFALAGALILFFRLYTGQGGLLTALAALLGVATLLPVMLTTGAFVSARWPARFHTSMERRDEQPRAALAIGVASASVGAAPLLAVARGAAGRGISALDLVWLGGAAALAWALAWALRPVALRAILARREAILGAVSRG